jgi:sulfide:quinone oxidoreductase
MPLDVLIAGGGPAALEAALTLHRVAPDHVAVTVLGPETEFSYRPLSVLGPFAAGAATRHPMSRIAADAGFEHRHDVMESVDAGAHTVRTRGGEELAYEALLVAVGAVPQAPYARAVTFGGPDDEERMHGLIQDVEGGYSRRIAFVVPPANSWPLPLYELALMLAQRAYEMGVDVELHLITPEERPLALFGDAPSREVAALLERAGIALHAGAAAEVPSPHEIRLSHGDGTLEVARVVTLPVLHGPHVPGLPADADGFLPTDKHGGVQGVGDVWAAGDAIAFPVKQGGLATQQADAAAEAIAARAGAPVTPEPFTPVLRGLLLTETAARYLRRDAREAAGEEAAVSGVPLWWPPTKIAGRELAAYLSALEPRDARGHRIAVPV